MSKVSIIIIPFRKNQLIKPVFDAIFSQSHQDLEVIAVINDPADGSKEIIQSAYPRVKLIVPGWNSWYAAGNNIGIRQSSGEFVQIVNDDVLLEPNYLQEMLKAFVNPGVGAATGKLLRYDFSANKKTNVIDSTGIVMQISGRAKDRGQLEEDQGQFDLSTEIFAVSGAAPMYRRSALEATKYCDGGKCEYFDEDFLAYWEDVDLSWRLNRAGYKNRYVPQAVAYHGRTAGQAKGGYWHLFHFIKHHQKLSPLVRKLNYRNHILMYLKNAKPYHPKFFLRELFMLGYILLFEPRTLAIFPDLFKLIPKIRLKRRSLKNQSLP